MFRNIKFIVLDVDHLCGLHYILYVTNCSQGKFNKYRKQLGHLRQLVEILHCTCFLFSEYQCYGAVVISVQQFEVVEEFTSDALYHNFL